LNLWERHSEAKADRNTKTVKTAIRTDGNRNVVFSTRNELIGGIEKSPKGDTSGKTYNRYLGSKTSPLHYSS